MVKLKTKFAFDVSLERSPQEYVTRKTKSISKFFVVVKEVIRKRLLRSWCLISSPDWLPIHPVKGPPTTGGPFVVPQPCGTRYENRRDDSIPSGSPAGHIHHPSAAIWARRDDWHASWLSSGPPNRPSEFHNALFICNYKRIDLYLRKNNAKTKCKTQTKPQIHKEWC